MTRLLTLAAFLAIFALPLPASGQTCVEMIAGINEVKAGAKQLIREMQVVTARMRELREAINRRDLAATGQASWDAAKREGVRHLEQVQELERRWMAASVKAKALLEAAYAAGCQW